MIIYKNRYFQIMINVPFKITEDVTPPKSFLSTLLHKDLFKKQSVFVSPKEF